MILCDIVNLLCLVNAIAFVAVTTYDSKESLVVHSTFLQDGFCLLKDPPWLHSHLLCFWVDALGASLLMRSNGAFAKRHGPGIAVHGIAHLALWTGVFKKNLQTPHTLMSVTGLTIFFYFLFRTLPKFPVLLNAVTSLSHALALATVIPDRFAFTYVQLALTSTALTCDLLKSSRDKAYKLSTMYLNVPVSLAAWPELFCGDLYKSYGGHLFYDATILVSTAIVSSKIDSVREKKN